MQWGGWEEKGGRGGREGSHAWKSHAMLGAVAQAGTEWGKERPHGEDALLRAWPWTWGALLYNAAPRESAIMQWSLSLFSRTARYGPARNFKVYLGPILPSLIFLALLLAAKSAKGAWKDHIWLPWGSHVPWFPNRKEGDHNQGQSCFFWPWSTWKPLWLPSR